MKLSLKDTPAFQSDITFDRKRLKNVEIKKPTEETKKRKNILPHLPNPQLQLDWVSHHSLKERAYAKGRGQVSLVTLLCYLKGKMCKVVKFKSLKVVHLKKFFEELFEVRNWKSKCPEVLYIKPLNEGFIIPLISFSSLLVSNFLKSYMVLSEYPTFHIWCASKTKTTEK